VEEWLRWLLAVVFALAAANFIRLEVEVYKVRRSLHDLRNKLPKIVMDYVKFAFHIREKNDRNPP
jgi:hypothetical protein